MLTCPGVYAILLALGEGQSIRIAKKGISTFPAGYYLYLGSAQGPGGLKSRLNRHCRLDKMHRWHIDYFRQAAVLKEVWAFKTTEQIECRWALAAKDLPGAFIPVPGFGASDCRCPSHLFYYPDRPDPDLFAQTAGVERSSLIVLPCRSGSIVEPAELEPEV